MIRFGDLVVRLESRSIWAWGRRVRQDPNPQSFASNSVVGFCVSTAIDWIVVIWLSYDCMSPSVSAHLRQKTNCTRTYTYRSKICLRQTLWSLLGFLCRLICLFIRDWTVNLRSIFCLSCLHRQRGPSHPSLTTSCFRQPPSFATKSYTSSPAALQRLHSCEFLLITLFPANGWVDRSTTLKYSRRHLWTLIALLRLCFRLLLVCGQTEMKTTWAAQIIPGDNRLLLLRWEPQSCSSSKINTKKHQRTFGVDKIIPEVGCNCRLAF